MLKALFGSAKDDPYNQALEHFRRLRDLASGDPAHTSNLLSIIRLCQLTIRQRPADGDAHVLLANAYLLAALTNYFGEVYQYALARSAAAIYHWKTVPMHSKERAIGERLLQGVNEQLEKQTPAWMGSGLNANMKDLHEKYYGSALDPATLDELARLMAQPDT